jgi:hypothetical protein
MDYRAFIRGITRAYEHKGGIKALHLGTLAPEWFRQIQGECLWLVQQAGSSDVTATDHVTNWTRPTGAVHQFSLFNASGNSADAKGDFGDDAEARKKRLVFPQLEGIRRFAGLFGSALRNLRLNGMGKSSALDAHEEQSISVTRFGTRHIVRFHLPVFTNATARIYLDDEIFRFEEGRLYFFHHGCVHAASNGAAEPRYHLVLDCFLSLELFRCLFPGHASPDAGFIKATDAASALHGEPFHFPCFVREDKGVIEGAIDYGRVAPGFLDYYRQNYPSVFRLLPKGK